MGVVAAALMILSLLPAFEVTAAASVTRTVSEQVDGFTAAGPPDGSGRVLSREFETPIVVTMAGFEIPRGSRVEVRAASREGDWSAWFEAEPMSVDDGPNEALRSEDAHGGTTVFTEPLWLGEARWLQLRIERGDPRAVRATVIDSAGLSRTRTERLRDSLRARPTAAQASPVPAEVVPRAGWGADESWMTWPPRTTSVLELAVVHHTAGGNTYTAAQGPAVVRGIYHYHAQTLGWGDIGYNMLVDRYGQVYEGRAGGLDQAVIAGHARGFNARSFGIAIMGDFETVAPPQAAQDALVRMLAWKLDHHGVDGSATVDYRTAGNTRFAAGTVLTLPTIVGHRDTGWTACPGAAFYARMGALRSSVNATQVPPTSAAEFVPLGPVRVLDSRPGGVGEVVGKVGSRQAVSSRVAGVDGVPADAKAVAINITAVRPSRATYLTVWPSGQPRPGVSSINVSAGAIVNNFVVAEVGAEGRLDIYNHDGEVDVVFDVVGYLPARADYVPLTPARVLDSRNSSQGEVSAPVGPRQTVAQRVAGVAGVPADAKAVAINITAVAPSQAGYLTVWPAGRTRPTASSINFAAGEVVGNFVFAEVGAEGRLDIYNHTGSTDVVLDVVGYVPAGANYTPLMPARVLDTRDPTQGELSTPVGRHQTRSQRVAGVGGVPADASAVAVNVTAVTPTAAGYLTVWPSGRTRPETSSINFPAGAVLGNLVIAEVGADGRVDIYNHDGDTHVVFDVVGYYP
jgi:hypothetical protein